MKSEDAAKYAKGALVGYFIGAILMLIAVNCHAQESVFPNDNAPVVMQQDSFGNIAAQQPGQAQWRFSPSGPSGYTYQQGLDRWGSVEQSGAGVQSFDNRLDGRYKYTFTPANPVPGVSKDIGIEGGRR